MYFIASHDITDSCRYEQDYVPGVRRTLAAVGGEVIVASGSASPIEGDASGQTVVLRFPSEQAFQDWHEGEDCPPLRKLRLATTTIGTALLANEFSAGATTS